MALDIWNGSAWVDAKNVQVWNGSAWVQSKKVKAWNGSAWVLSWVPPVPSLAVTFSKNGVAPNEGYDVYATLSIPAPEGTVVTFTSGAYSQPVATSEGDTVVTLPGASHASAGSFSWTATAVNLGGTTVSPVASQTVTAPAPTEIVTGDGSYLGVAGGGGLENAMWDARCAGLPLRVVGTWSLSKNAMWIPDGVTVRAHGAVFNHNPMARFRNSGPWPGCQTTEAGREMSPGVGGYGGGGFHWEGGTFSGNGDGIFTLSHSPGFTIRDATFYNWCSSSNTGHAIEINSSGGNDNASGEYGTYTVNILANSFGGVTGQRSNSNDEAVHYDWAWSGSGVWGQADHTMCHNVKIEGNTFHTNYGGGSQFARCAIGGHDPSGGLRPTNRHNHFTIRSNAIHGAVGSTETSPDKGAIHNYWIRSSWIVFNNLYGCTPARLISCELPAEASASSPYFNNLGANTHNGSGNPNVYATGG